MVLRGDLANLRVDPSGAVAVEGFRDQGATIVSDIMATVAAFGVPAAKAVAAAAVADKALDALDIIANGGGANP